MPEVSFVVDAEVAPDFRADLGEYAQSHCSEETEIGWGGRPPRPGSLQDGNAIVEVIMAMKGPLLVLAPVLAFWLGKGRLAEIAVRGKRIVLRNYSAKDLVEVLNALSRLAAANVSAESPERPKCTKRGKSGEAPRA